MSENRATYASQTSDLAAPRPLTPPPVARGLLEQVRWLVTDAPYAHVVVPAATFLLITACTLWLWRWQAARELADVRNDTELIAPAAADRFEIIVKDELRPLTRFSRELGNDTIATKERFLESVAAVRTVVPSLKTVAWVDPSGVVQAVSPPAHEAEIPLGQSLRDDPHWGVAYKNSLNPKPHPTVVGGQFDEQAAQWVCLPYREPSGRRTRGIVMARVSFGERAVDEFAVPAWRGFRLSVRDAEGNVIYASSPAPAGAGAGADADVRACAAEHDMPVLDAVWTMRLEPTAAFIADRRNHTTLMLLGGGMTTAGLSSALLAQGLLHRRRERRRITDHLAALAALAKVSATINDAPASPSDLLARLARVAARLMNMSMSGVTLYNPSDRSMRVVFRENLPNPNGRDVYDVDETPCSAECMRTRRPVAFEDVEAPGSPFPPGHMGRFGIRSLILVPLIVSDQAAGVLMLCDGAPRRFTELGRRLVDLWMIQASAILSNRKLYEGMTAAMENERQILHQRAKLYEVNTRIQYAPSLRDAMRLVAELAPQALEFHACVVCLAHPTPGHVLVAAVTPGQATDELREDVVAECATCAGVMASGELKRVEDLREHPVRGFPHMGSALFVPLMSGGAPVGLLVLLRIARGPFSAEQVRVAELFAARAAAKLESDRLLEQTRRQADTNAILLRELNHRVGNTFAGIIGLLKVAARELPGDARAPLDRAVQRVMTMSRAHELFSGGVRSVRLADLVQTTVASVSSFGDGDVRINVELHDPDARLFSTRAVTLAMALHELAYNAVEHALGGGGELTVRSRATANRRVAIDVIDRAAVPALVAGSVAEAPDPTDGNGNGHAQGNGNGNGAGDATGSRRRRGNGHAGIGLQLVRNLVARELGGRFDLDTTASGTTATIEFSPEQESECAL